jgi:hypothetical protein
VIPAATGTISQSFIQYQNNIPGKHEIKELQTTTILCTAHTHTAGSADVQYRTFFMCEITSHVAQTEYRTAVTLCTLQTWFVSGMLL